MIRYTSGGEYDNKFAEKVCKKLKLDKEGVSFVAYDKFLFAFVFALAIKDGEIHLFATDEDGKKEGVRSTYPLSKVKGIQVDKKTDVNLYLTNGKFINLTSAVGVTKNGKQTVTALNAAIKNNKK